MSLDMMFKFRISARQQYAEKMLKAKLNRVNFSQKGCSNFKF